MNTVNGLIKKEEKEGSKGEKPGSHPRCCKDTVPYSQGQTGRLGEASSFFTIT
jgi:hypothetical protein